MRAKITITQVIRHRIEQIPLGEPFRSVIFLEYGTRTAVDKTLSRLVSAGMIKRVSRGVFVRPRVNRYLGEVLPEPQQVVEFLAKTNGEVVQVHGAEAARRFELTTQVPMLPIYNTSGRSKRLKIGKLEVRLHHTSLRKLALAGRPAGLALTALWYLGKNDVNSSIIDKVRHKLSENEYQALRSAIDVMPGWLIEAFRKYDRR